MFTKMSFCIVLASVVAPSPARSAETIKDCQLKQYASLDLKRIINRAYLVPVTLQNVSGYMFLDTTQGISSVTTAAADRLHLELQPMPHGVKLTAEGISIKKVATIKELAFGGARFARWTLLVLPAAATPQYDAHPEVFGILGMDIFQKLDVELDLANNKMNLFAQDHCPGQVVYWSQTSAAVPLKSGGLHELYFTMELDGKKLETTMATGAPSTTLATDVTRKLYDFDQFSPGVDSETDSSRRIYAHYRAMKLSNEGVTVFNAHINLIDPRVKECRVGTREGAATYDGCTGVHPLELGLNVLTKLHLYIATKEKMLYITPAEPKSVEPATSETTKESAIPAAAPN